MSWKQTIWSERIDPPSWYVDYPLVFAVHTRLPSYPRVFLRLLYVYIVLAILSKFTHTLLTIRLSSEQSACVRREARSQRRVNKGIQMHVHRSRSDRVELGPPDHCSRNNRTLQAQHFFVSFESCKPIFEGIKCAGAGHSTQRTIPRDNTLYFSVE